MKEKLIAIFKDICSGGKLKVSGFTDSWYSVSDGNGLDVAINKRTLCKYKDDCVTFHAIRVKEIATSVEKTFPIEGWEYDELMLVYRNAVKKIRHEKLQWDIKRIGEIDKKINERFRQIADQYLQA